eukprot:CAMPEP_0168165904 /NCGR_PEP_ID=MMETSP0139_2-20121125/1729_1 /TAXON_ID=44445 /ORGANISM="Pseudo-nitzschia australis, Strain 10249 10 AB" /LENGTH=64 /DNA_ID=CAMNT_0008083039 /DNA_START=754 /DNA_END=945 /DNA_ORIENTATION=+
MITYGKGLRNPGLKGTGGVRNRSKRPRSEIELSEVIDDETNLGEDVDAALSMWSVAVAGGEDMV